MHDDEHNNENEDDDDDDNGKWLNEEQRINRGELNTHYLRTNEETKRTRHVSEWKQEHTLGARIYQKIAPHLTKFQ